MLIQKDHAENERPVCFLSRKLQGAKVNYPTVKKELLAVVYSVSKLRKYLNESEFLLVPTALLYAFVPKTEASSRQQRWIMAVQEFKFNVKHVADRSNVVFIHALQTRGDPL